MTLDIVYPVRPGDRNDELRFSLRSLVNFPHGDIWVVGYKPRWLTGVRYIPGNKSMYEHANIFNNILSVCENPNLPSEFVLFNDDFFVTRPVDKAPNWYRCTLQEHIDNPGVRGWWRDSLETTMETLVDQGFSDPLSYELHVPIQVEKHTLASTLGKFIDVKPHNPPQWRTLYGNINAIGGSVHNDTKVRSLTIPFHSTSDVGFKRRFCSHYVKMFPQPSQYEKM